MQRTGENDGYRSSCTICSRAAAIAGSHIDSVCVRHGPLIYSGRLFAYVNKAAKINRSSPKKMRPYQNNESLQIERECVAVL